MRQTTKIMATILFGLLVAPVLTMAQVWLISPTDGTTDLASPVILQWSGSGINWYALQVDDDPDFSSPFLEQYDLYSNNKLVIGLEQNTTYYWRVDGYIVPMLWVGWTEP